MLPIARIASACLAALLLTPGGAAAKQTYTNNRALAFGKFVAGSGGTITITPAGARTGAGVFLVNSTVSSASFTWSDNSPANANKVCAIGLPGNGTVTLSNGSSSMAVNDFTSNPSGTSLMSGGTLTFTVGATLTVNANQPKGNYSGSFSVTIQYQ